MASRQNKGDAATRVKAHIRSQPRRILRGWITAVTKERPFNGWQNSEGNLN